MVLLALAGGLRHPWGDGVGAMEHLQEGATEKDFWEMAHRRGVGDLQRWLIEADVEVAYRELCDVSSANAGEAWFRERRRVFLGINERIERRMDAMGQEWWERNRGTEWLIGRVADRESRK